MTKWTVTPADAGTRLDKFLAHAERLVSRGRAMTAIEKGKVFVNDEEMTHTAASRRLDEGDRVRVWMDRPGSAHRTSRVRPIADLLVVYQDDSLIVINKPAGLLTVPLERRSEASSVEEQLIDHLRSRGKRRPFVVHRIDRDTSGLVVFALKADVQEALREQFKRHHAERVYLAVVYGCPSPSSGVWRDQLVWDERALIQKETHPRDPLGKEARSEYRVVERFRDASLIEVKLVTGKRNQIRLQARLRGHTLVGEQRYVYGPDELRTISFTRQALHAHTLAFRHPKTTEIMRFEAPVPQDFEDLVKRLRKPSARVPLSGPEHPGPTSNTM